MQRSRTGSCARRAGGGGGCVRRASERRRARARACACVGRSVRGGCARARAQNASHIETAAAPRASEGSRFARLPVAESPDEPRCALELVSAAQPWLFYFYLIMRTRATSGYFSQATSRNVQLYTIANMSALRETIPLWLWKYDLGETGYGNMI